VAHPDREWLTAIFVTYLAGNAEGLDVGLGQAPETPNPAYPYLVVTPLAPFDIDGSLGSINELQSMEWQVASVGLTAQQALGGITAATDRLVGTTGPDFSPASYTKTGEVKLVPTPGLSSDYSDKPALFISNETYRMMLVPA